MGGGWPTPRSERARRLAAAVGDDARATVAARRRRRGQGRYGAAHRDLAALRRAAPAGRLASLGMSTQGSFVRQLGWHTVARRWDGRALALAGADPEAGADALIGLAADALGVGRFAAAAALLARADPVLAATDPKTPVPDRIPVRRRWVAAELAMARGEVTSPSAMPARRWSWRRP